MTKVKYRKQWRIPSSSESGKFYTVSLTMNDQYICHCWPFLRTRKECNHILLAKSGEFENIEPPTEQQRTDALIIQYAKKGYRYLTWVAGEMYPWDKRQLDTIRHSPNFDDVKTFMAYGRKIIVVKEKPQVYQNEIASFTREIGALDFRRVRGNHKEEIQGTLRKKFFDLTQHVLFNNSQNINPNLPDGSVCTKGTYGRQLHRMSMKYKWLR